MSDVLLTVDGLSAGYVPDLPILHDVSMCVARAAITVIIGPNGAGKSTLIKAIAGLVPVSSGRVALDNQVITHVPAHEMSANGVSYVPQNDNIFRSLTIRENLELALRNAGAPGRDRLNTLLAQFPTLAEKQHAKAGALSGGQRQFLAVANALATNPSLILLDEPSAGLSPKAAEEVLGLVQDLTKTGVTVLLVEQNVKLALRIADYCYILAEGRNRFEGKASELLGDSVIADIYLGAKRRTAVK